MRHYLAFEVDKIAAAVASAVVASAVVAFAVAAHRIADQAAVERMGYGSLEADSGIAG